ncbi:MAG: hypothetical protein CL674_11145 [Bdellovibrionaceae bacterium]|nr:hypothetical protein [Pseudobdellovibrionaceae bacterium]
MKLYQYTWQKMAPEPLYSPADAKNLKENTCFYQFWVNCTRPWSGLDATYVLPFLTNLYNFTIPKGGK